VQVGVIRDANWLTLPATTQPAAPLPKEGIKQGQTTMQYLHLSK
jgi:hypothetical protein